VAARAVAGRRRVASTSSRSAAALAIPARKTEIPQTPRGHVRRSRLLAELTVTIPTADDQGSVVVVCAPAGYGKTTLLAEWAEDEVVGARGVAWVTVDPDDNAPYRLWSAILIALVSVVPSAVRRQLEDLRPTPVGCQKSGLGR